MHTRREFVFSCVLSAAPLLSEVLAEVHRRQTEIIVVGTVHQPTPNFTKRQLTTILERLFPSVILFQVDSSFINRRSQQLWPEHGGLEGEAVRDLQARFPFPVPVRPYDIEGRNQIYQDHHYFSLQREFYKALNNFYRQDQFGPEARSLYEEVMASLQIVQTFADAKPEIINSALCDAAIHQKYEKYYSNVRRIIELTPSLAEFMEYAKFDEEFWIQRNDAMVRNIVNQVKYFPGMRMVVICGFEHRYYLLGLLKPLEATFGFSLREYWSNQ